ncbi:hypothetical protein SLEP1_g49437 [Rubroshorea leprosula]|uniref:Uncharacterized protein n=1 Tax=Rubroshorea leprosula TaxID=152421 RepID=A0AAV5LWT1_9ROSI|nr:hypothetical protein SLEP1_g49437 [Rubroshorea leprosula]
MVECISLAIHLVKGVRFPLALLILCTLYHMVDLLHSDEILGASYSIIETYLCLSLLQMFAWERFHSYHFGHVAKGKALKEYLLAMCGYTSGTAPLTYSWIGKRKVKGQVLEADGFLDDHGNFNFHTYKTMLGALPKPSRDARSDCTIHAAMHYMVGNMGPRVLLPKQSYEVVIDDAGAEGEANEVVPSKKPILGKRKSVAYPPKSKAQRISTSLANKQSKATAPMPSNGKNYQGEKDG